MTGSPTDHPLVVPHRLPGPARPAVLLERENRFLARCALAGPDASTVVHAHVPDRGRLERLLVPGARVWLYDAPAATPGKPRRTRHSLLVAEEPATGTLVAIDPAAANSRTRALLADARSPFGTGWHVRPEFTFEDARFDFLLTRGAESLLVEVKSVGVVDAEKVARFPDAPTARGVRHLATLRRWVRAGRGRAAVLFVAQRGDALAIAPDAVIDPAFAAALAESAAEIDLHGCAFAITPEGATFAGLRPVHLA